MDWTVLGEHAVTRYSGNPLTRYAISGKSAVGYAELEPGVGWSYWEFRTPSDKKDTKPVEPKRHDGVFPSALAAMKSALG